MRKKLTALVVGFAAAGAMVAPAATGSATAKASSCFYIQQFRTPHKYATDIPDTLWLYFEASERTSYCFDSAGTPFYYRIRDNSTGNCLSEDDSVTDGQGHPEVHEESCSPNYAWEQWYWNTTDNGAADYFANMYSGWCLYDNTQEPAIVASCSSPPVNQFQWFLMTGSL